MSGSYNMAFVCYDVDNLVLYQLGLSDISRLVQTSKYWQRRMGWYMDHFKGITDDSTLDDQFIKACEMSNLKMVQWLWLKGIYLNQPIDINARNGYVLMISCHTSRPVIIKWLCNKGADLECTVSSGWRPIHMLCHYHTPEMIRYIIDKGVDLECATVRNWRPIHFICRYSTPEMIRYIIDKGVDLECANDDDLRPIHLICRYSTPEMIKYIIDKGVDLECADNHNWKPIHYICCFSAHEMIKYIIDKGVDLESAADDGWRPIHFVCCYSTLEAIQYIISKGVDLTAAIARYDGIDVEGYQSTIPYLLEQNGKLTKEDYAELMLNERLIQAFPDMKL